MERGLPVERVVTYLTDGLIRNRLLEEQDREIYEYGLGRLVGKAVSYTALLGLSLLIGTFVPGLWFLAFFFTLRGRTGGYHAATERGCFLGDNGCLSGGHEGISAAFGPLAAGRSGVPGFVRCSSVCFRAGQSSQS